MTTYDLQELSDRLQIRELCEKYAMAITVRDWDALAECFHEDATWQVLQAGVDLSSRDGIVDGLKVILEANPFYLQMLHGVTIDTLDGSRATARAILNEVGQLPGGESGMNALGNYNDVITKVDGVWKFQSRAFHIHYMDGAPFPGTVMVDYASLNW